MSHCLLPLLLSHGHGETTTLQVIRFGRRRLILPNDPCARPICATSSPQQRNVLRRTHMVSAREASNNYDPCVWGDFFINYTTSSHYSKQKSEEWMTERGSKLKDDVRTLFEITCNDVVGRMHLVDAVQRLGIGHLFEEEISSTLSDINGCEFNSSSLHEVALRFRLLREHGFSVSSDAFNKFRGEDGRFMSGLADDPRGLLSLYNAAHLQIHDEPELEEAVSFAKQHLQSMSDQLKPPLINQVNRALHLSLPRSFKRVETLRYMVEYEQEEGHIPVLVELAKIDFNLLQQVHLKELKAISTWWKDLYAYVELSYVRDRVVESYVWSHTVLYEEELAIPRMILAKIIAFIIIMDDTYDAHATIQDCRKLNQAIQRWDEIAISSLPEYMKKFYIALLNNFKVFEAQVAVDAKHQVAHVRNEFQKLSSYYLQEAEWSHEDHKPSFKERAILSTKTSAVPLLCAAASVGRRSSSDVVKSFELATTYTAALIACSKIMRLMNDIAAFKCRRKDKGDAASTVECYMNEHKVTSEDALAVIDSLIEHQWKTLNQARCQHRELLPAMQRVVNLAISVPFFYGKKKDAFTSSDLLQEVVQSLFVNPVPF